MCAIARPDCAMPYSSLVKGDWRRHATGIIEDPEVARDGAAPDRHEHAGAIGRHRRVCIVGRGAERCEYSSTAVIPHELGAWPGIRLKRQQTTSGHTEKSNAEECRVDAHLFGNRD